MSFVTAFFNKASRAAFSPDIRFAFRKFQGSRCNFTTEEVRLSVVLSRYAKNLSISRREAERLIRSGSVTISGEVVTSPQLLCPLEHFERNEAFIKVEGRPIHIDTQKGAAPGKNAGSTSNNNNNNTRVWLVNKLAGELVTDSDPQGRPTLMERLKRGGVGKRGKHSEHIKSIGRLDMNTEGLVVVTNDGNYAREMELPSNKLHRTYRVRVHGLLSEYKLSRMQRGVTVEGVRYAPMKVELDEVNRRKNQATNKWIKVTCCEGKNRQIRKVLQYLGLNVTRLIRISYGDYHLNTIPPGMAIEMPFKPLDEHKRKGPLFFKRQRSIATNEKDSAEASPVQWIRNT